MKGKVFLGLIFGVVFIGMITSTASARMYVRQEPPGKTAVIYIGGITGLAGGQVVWNVTRVGSKYQYQINSVLNPQGILLDVDFLNSLVNEVISNPKLRSNEVINQFITDSIYKKYPGLKSLVDDALEKTLGPGTILRRDIEGLLGHAVTSDGDIGFLNSFADKLKKDYSLRSLRLDIIYKSGLKDSVASYIQTYAGENFDIINGLHNGTLSFFSEWANSLKESEQANSRDGAISTIANYVNILITLKDSICQNIYNGVDINIFNGLESGIPGYLASLKLVDPNVDLNTKIADIGSKMQELRNLLALRETLNSYAGGIVSEDMVSRFAAMMLGKSLSAWEDKLLFDWSQGVSSKESEDVMFNLSRLADKLEIVNKARADLSIDQIFDLNRDIITDSPDKAHVNLQEWMVRLIDDMSYVKGEFEAKFGAGSIDVNNPVHEAVLVDYASRIADLVDFDEQGHNVARELIAEEIDNMKEENFKDLFSAELDLSPVYAVEQPVFDDNIGGETPVFGVSSDPIGNIF